MKTAGVHTGPPHLKEGGQQGRNFCPVCKLTVKLCKLPTTHTQSNIPEICVGHAARLEHKDREQASTWSYQCINMGSLRSSSLLTSSLTLINGNDTIQIEALWDSGSESSFFSPALLPFAMSQRSQSFKIETLSPSASKPELVHGIEAVFPVAVPDGEVVQLKLKPKVLTCDTAFAEKLKEKRNN